METAAERKERPAAHGDTNRKCRHSFSLTFTRMPPAVRARRRGTCISPYFCSQFRRSPHRRALLDSKRLVKLREIHVRTDCAELAGRMRVNRDAPAQFGFAPVRSPELRKRQKKTLLRREAVDVLSL